MAKEAIFLREHVALSSSITKKQIHKREKSIGRILREK